MAARRRAARRGGTADRRARRHARAGPHADPEQRRFVETVARQVATPLDRVRLLERERDGAAPDRAAPGAHGRPVRRSERRGGRGGVPRARGGGARGRRVGDRGARRAREPPRRRSGGAASTSPPVEGAVDGDGAPRCAASARGLVPPPPDDRPHAGAPRARVSGARRARPEQGVQLSVVCPLGTAGRVLGVAAFSWRRPHSRPTDDSALVASLASQCAQALDRARRYESERTIAETLQRSVLPELLPSIDGLDVAARYLPGTTGSRSAGLVRRDRARERPRRASSWATSSARASRRRRR